MINRFFYPKEHSFFLFGPRGTGKSTLMKSMYQDAIWIDFLNPQTERQYSAYPEKLYSLLEANKSNKIVVIDEVQKVPKILSIVHDYLERKQGWQFILTGSSSRKIKRSGADLLAGRALGYTFYPFIASELQEEFSLEEALKFGMLPLIHQSQEKEKVLQAYIHLYLKEEIQAEGLVRNIEGFSRFLEVMSFSHGSILNISNVARECEVKRKTVESYSTILDDLLLSITLPSFEKKAKREVIKSSKFYFFDTGVYKALRPTGLLDKVHEIDGAGLEGLVLQHLKAWSAYSKHKSELFFWRTKAGVEVDFIVHGEQELIAIEVKNSKSIRKSNTKPLKSFLQDYPVAKGVILYRGKERVIENGILHIPVEDFLLKLKPNEELTKILSLDA